MDRAFEDSPNQSFQDFINDQSQLPLWDYSTISLATPKTPFFSVIFCYFFIFSVWSVKKNCCCLPFTVISYCTFECGRLIAVSWFRLYSALFCFCFAPLTHFSRCIISEAAFAVSVQPLHIIVLQCLLLRVLDHILNTVPP